MTLVGPGKPVDDVSRRSAKDRKSKIGPGNLVNMYKQNWNINQKVISKNAA